MLPITEVRGWREQAPWGDDDDVEQDLIITRALFDIFEDPFLAHRLALRGGTALHRLYLAPPARSRSSGMRSRPKRAEYAGS